MMKNVMGVHHIPLHQTGAHAEFFRALRPALYKVVISGESVDLGYCPPGARLIVRSHPISENYGHRNPGDALLPPSAFGSRGVMMEPLAPVHRPVVLPEMVEESRSVVAIAATEESARQCGVEHADAYARIAANLPAEVRGRAVFSGLNEPQLWSVEPPRLHAVYSLAFVQRLHEYGLRGAWGCFGVGWPGNSGTGTAPVWEPWREVAAAMLPGDVLEVHEYWWDGGPENGWGWWAGRYSQCPFDVPVFIGESGRDGGVAGLPKQGWMVMAGDWPEKARRYMAELAWYEEQLRKDDRVVGHTPFTCDGSGEDWALFEVLEPHLMGEMVAHQEGVHAGADPVRRPLPEDEPEGGCGFLAEKVRWWLEEYTRRVEWGELEYAEEILYSLIGLDKGLLYRLERVVKGCVYATNGVTLVA